MCLIDIQQHTDTDTNTHTHTHWDTWKKGKSKVIHTHTHLGAIQLLRVWKRGMKNKRLILMRVFNLATTIEKYPFINEKSIRSKKRAWQPNHQRPMGIT